MGQTSDIPQRYSPRYDNKAIGEPQVRAGSTLVSLIRELARAAAYWTGALSLYHRLRNRKVLTVVSFHRVLRRDDPRWATALSPWTLDDDTFAKCLAFFKRHYTLVTLDAVRASLARTRRLPSRSLLITFDDGYADNIDYALPLLHEHGAAATIFITQNVVGRAERLWTEDLLWAFEAGLVVRHQVAKLHALLFGGGTYEADDSRLVWDIVRRGPQLEESRVHMALSMLNIELCRIDKPRQMLNSSEIADLVAHGISIGAHGKTHTALPLASNVADELRSPRTALGEVAILRGQRSVDALSFPHGLYTTEIVDQALASGYTLLFTGTPEACVLKHGFLASPLVGRIDIDSHRVAPNGRFRPDALAALLFAATRQRAAHARRDFSDGEHQPFDPPTQVPARAGLFGRARAAPGGG